MVEQPLTHLDPLGRARMVDVTQKEVSARRATARGRVLMTPETTALIARGEVSKGDVLAVARVAGIQAAKRTSDLIPLCHPVGIGGILINFRIGTMPVYLILIGLGYAAIYYFLFRFVIRKWNLKTPGREDEGAESSLAADPTA